MGSQENVCPQAWGGRGAVLREVRRLAASPPPGIKLLLQEDDLTHLTAIIAGPAETPYAGGSFRVRLWLDGGYPSKPPRAVFETRIFHPNVSANGEVCVSTLSRDWRPTLGLAHALVSVRSLLLAPNAESALNAEAAALLRDDRPAFHARARLYTDIHATNTNNACVAPDHDNQHQQNAGDAGDAGGGGSGEEGPSAKRERPAPAPAPVPSRADRRDRRRILKRL